MSEMNIEDVLDRALREALDDYRATKNPASLAEAGRVWRVWTLWRSLEPDGPS